MGNASQGMDLLESHTANRAIAVSQPIGQEKHDYHQF